ncbi:N-acetylglucosamine-6-phosphate deacetylase [Shimia sp. Alg240-R146]|uniref:N-acetylglucosamine-6-phosphate deacetylase n=1 Tax=Shimia sp. Alg240-R146 TaxID=2993449 RepID=UPI0022E5F7C1|nr:N-acetylglucosamine-6-phosphate deacetylase [Shimia sp. Alg240-R146]
MISDVVMVHGGPIFDGSQLHDNRTARFDGGLFSGFVASPETPDGARVINLDGNILSTGFVDLQVNGGDGLMLNDAPTVETLQRMVTAHKRLGCSRILPTLITDTPEKTHLTIAATIAAIQQGISGIAGLHLEGPHLSVARKGAHDASLIRPMTDVDLAELLKAADRLPALKITIAPENVSLAQVKALNDAGVLVSLGHTDASFDTCMTYFNAGARCVTHLFNAMSQLGNREPGLVGAALASGSVSAGLIADGIHVHTQSLRAAWQAKTGPGRLFLVSDAMAVAGTDVPEFQLEGRRIARRHGRLTLEDGTLAGADLDLTTAVRILKHSTGVSLETALQAAITTPASLIDLGEASMLTEGTALGDLVRISRDLHHIDRF